MVVDCQVFSTGTGLLLGWFADIKFSFNIPSKYSKKVGNWNFRRQECEQGKNCKLHMLHTYVTFI